MIPRPDAGRDEWLVIQLDDGVLRSRILPDLAQRYFQGTDGLDYEVAVVGGTPPRRVIYSSDPGFGEQEVVDADGRMDVFGRPSDADVAVARIGLSQNVGKQRADGGGRDQLVSASSPGARRTRTGSSW